jgi:uncharacterized protein YndB with AHSA1/START domain
MSTDGGTPLLAGWMRRTFGFAAPKWRVFEALVDEIDGWWCHRSEPESAFRLEGGLGGQLVERGVEGVRVLGVISAFERPSLIRLEGQLLLPRSVESVVTFEVQGEHGAGLAVTHEWRGDRLITPSALRHSWGELLGGCLREYVDAGSALVGREWGAKYPMASALVG